MTLGGNLITSGGMLHRLRGDGRPCMAHSLVEIIKKQTETTDDQTELRNRQG